MVNNSNVVRKIQRFRLPNCLGSLKCGACLFNEYEFQAALGGGGDAGLPADDLEGVVLDDGGVGVVCACAENDVAA